VRKQLGIFLALCSTGVAVSDHKVFSHQLTDLPTARTLPTVSTAPSMLSYSSPGTASGPHGAGLGWYSTTQCATSRYRSLFFPAPEYHLPVPANCHMNGTVIILLYTKGLKIDTILKIKLVGKW